MTKSKKTVKYLLGTLAGIFALRAFKLAYQRSRLEKLLENIVGGQDRTVVLDQTLIDTLPKTSLSFSGKPADPINLMFLGKREQIEAAFRRLGWTEAVAINASNWAKAFWAGIRNLSYSDGPMTPFYIATTPNDLAFQKETDRQSFRERHHIRLWQTNLRLAGAIEIWLATTSFDRSLRLFRGARMPFHHIDPDLDAERDLIAGQLVQMGATRRGDYKLTRKHEGRNVFHDRYFTDGHVIVIDLSQVEDAS
jgi:hypothetical protein